MATLLDYDAICSLYIDETGQRKGGKGGGTDLRKLRTHVRHS